MNTLFSKFSIASLGCFPTSVVPMQKIGPPFNHDRLFIKQDNLSGPIYGGNKIRKLEFLLGEALSKKHKSVITYGAAGSNHATATAVCCRQLGLKAISVLAPQPTSDHVRKNILMQHAAGAELQLCNHYGEFDATTETLSQRCIKKDGIEPYIIPAGGTNALGALGFANAAFELIEQIRPDVIYLPMGTGGTHAGLLTGLRLAGLDTRVEAIRVTHPKFRDKSSIKQLSKEICTTIAEHILPQRHRETVNQDLIDSAPQRLSGEKIHQLESGLLLKESDIIIRDEFFGEDYGIPTSEGEEAVDFFRSEEGIYLENTYTGKTAAALLNDLRSGRLDGQTVLYWNTLNSRDFSEEINDIDYHALPKGFHPYFE